MHILLIEDDTKLSRLVAKALEADGYVCDNASTIESARRKIDKDGYDLIILDLVLPDGDGVDYCREIRASAVSTPVLILTSRSRTIDKISGLDAGADDYMPKPFSPNELKARIRALLRRPQQTIGEEIICGDIKLNVLSHVVTRSGKQVSLMPKEYSLLEYLMRKKNLVVKKEELLRHVWGIYSKTSSNRLEVYIRYLREKIDLPFGQQTIKTVRGLGYKIAED